MRWHRRETGVYRSGPWTVKKFRGPRWYPTGPCLVDGLCYDTKYEAQEACEYVALQRCARGDTVAPAFGDVAIVDTSTGHVTSTFTDDEGVTFFCVTFPRGKKLWLQRSEFRIGVP